MIKRTEALGGFRTLLRTAYRAQGSYERRRTLCVDCIANARARAGSSQLSLSSYGVSRQSGLVRPGSGALARGRTYATLSDTMAEYRRSAFSAKLGCRIATYQWSRSMGSASRIRCQSESRSVAER